MEIKVEIRNVYGEQKVYPMCETAKDLAALTGCITLTPHAIQLIKKLGYKITVIQPVITL
jgi:hypothetical protein